MSTVLEKAVLTDDTGKQIKGTLEEIRDAITGSGSTHYPVRIQVATPPEKVDYIEGETLDLTGIIVNAIFDNGVPYDVTENCTFDPDDGDTLTAQDTAINVTWTWTLGEVVQTFHASRAINVSTVESIEITTPPDTVDYTVGDTLDLTGMVVKANMSNNTQIDVTSQCTYSPDDGDTLTTSDTAITATLSVSGSTFTATQAITVTIPIYGVEWDGSSSPAFTRTDLASTFVDPVPQKPDGNGGWTTGSSPFDNLAPWSGMERVEDSDAGTLVKIPKFYYKRTVDNNGGTNAYKLQISPVQAEGFSVSPAHMDRGDGQGERDFVYVGAYVCASDYKSKTGVLPIGSIKLADARTNIHNLGSDIWQFDLAMYETIKMLYLVEFANWNSQAKIGNGGNNNGNAPVNTGGCDSMTYHTGTDVTPTNSGNVRYRWIEGLWSNVPCFIDGVYGSSGGWYLFKNPADYATSGGTSANHGVNISGKLIQFMWQVEVSGFEWVTMPGKKFDSTDYSTYVTDSCNMSTTSVVIVLGISAYSDNNGLFQLYGSTVNFTDYRYGCRLQKLPSNS